MSKDKSSDYFLRGYSCCISDLINLKKGVDADVRSLYKVGMGATTYRQMRNAGVSEDDISVYKKYKKQLLK